MGISVEEMEKRINDDKDIDVNSLVPENKGYTKKRPLLEDVKTYFISKKTTPYKDVTTVAQLKMKVQQLEDVLMKVVECVNWKQ